MPMFLKIKQKSFILLAMFYVCFIAEVLCFILPTMFFQGFLNLFDFLISKRLWGISLPPAPTDSPPNIVGNLQYFPQ
jgi:hypothetical protein